MDDAEDYFPDFAKRIRDIQNILKSRFDDSQKIIQIKEETIKIIRWLVDDRRIEQSRAAWAWFTFLYNSYGGRYATVRDYVDDVLKMQIGYYTRKEQEGIKDGKKCIYIFLKVKSFNHHKCGSKEFSACLRKISDYTYEKYGITMDQFLDAEWNKEDQCQYPTCHNQWTDTHEIFGGHGVRKEFSIKNGWQVHTCRGHHDLSGGINDGNTPERLMLGMKEKMARIWCGVKKINYRECLRIINKIKK